MSRKRKTHRPLMVTVSVSFDRMGALVIRPTGDRARRSVKRGARWVRKMGGFAALGFPNWDVSPDEDGSIYIQRDYNIEEFLSSYMPSRHRPHLSRGYSVRFRMPKEDFDAMTSDPLRTY